MKLMHFHVYFCGALVVEQLEKVQFDVKKHIERNTELEGKNKCL